MYGDCCNDYSLTCLGVTASTTEPATTNAGQLSCTGRCGDYQLDNVCNCDAECPVYQDCECAAILCLPTADRGPPASLCLAPRGPSGAQQASRPAVTWSNRRTPR